MHTNNNLTSHGWLIPAPLVTSSSTMCRYPPVLAPYNGERAPCRMRAAEYT